MNESINGIGHLLLVAPVKIGGVPMEVGSDRVCWVFYLFWVTEILKE